MPLPVLGAWRRGASSAAWAPRALLAQRDAPIINTGILFAQHVRGSNESDAVVEWLLAEANNRIFVATLNKDLGIEQGVALIGYDADAQDDADLEALRPSETAMGDGMQQAAQTK